MHFASNQAKTTDDVNALSFIKHLNVEGMPTANIASQLMAHKYDDRLLVR